MMLMLMMVVVVVVVSVRFAGCDLLAGALLEE